MFISKLIPNNENVQVSPSKETSMSFDQDYPFLVSNKLISLFERREEASIPRAIIMYICYINWLDVDHSGSKMHDTRPAIIHNPRI